MRLAWGHAINWSLDSTVMKFQCKGNQTMNLYSTKPARANALSIHCRYHLKQQSHYRIKHIQKSPDARLLKIIFSSECWFTSSWRLFTFHTDSEENTPQKDDYLLFCESLVYSAPSGVASAKTLFSFLFYLNNDVGFRMYPHCFMNKVILLTFSKQLKKHSFLRWLWI